MNVKTMNLNKLSSSIPTTAFTHMVSIVDKYDISSPLRLAHFMAQVAHESGNFSLVVENLNYSADRLMQVFPRYFPTRQLAMEYARNAERIGSRVYGNRMGNGDEASKEGFAFRGRGYLQLTGKNNYRDFSTFIGEDCVANPNLVATKYPMDSAIWFFNRNNLWAICDQGSTDAIVTQVTRAVNGGTNGLADRLSKFKLFHNGLQV
jgi:putative chitinase